MISPSKTGLKRALQAVLERLAVAKNRKITDIFLDEI